jgi:hypothetical protein
MNIGIDYYNLLYMYLLDNNSPNTGPLLNEDAIVNVPCVLFNRPFYAFQIFSI